VDSEMGGWVKIPDKQVCVIRQKDPMNLYRGELGVQGGFSLLGGKMD
jgi:hypothetical protein